MVNLLSAKQIEAVELLSTGLQTCEQIATVIGVVPQTISKWRHDPEFTSTVIQRAQEHIKHALPDVYRILVQKAREGSIMHIRTLLEHIDNITAVDAIAKHEAVSFAWLEDE